jgi:hypothetical protein
MLPSRVSIPVVTERCKKKCCFICALPLQCCVVLSVYKSQGNTVKKNNAFEALIVNLPTEQTRTTPALELVALSRPDSIHNLAIGNNSSDLSHVMIMKIGTAASNAKRRLFLNRIQQMATQTQQELGIYLHNCAHCHCMRGVHKIVELVQ